jgi:hypothetical protein
MSMFNRPKARPAPAEEPKKEPVAAPLTKEDVATMIDAGLTSVAGALENLNAGIADLATRPVVAQAAPVAAAAQPGITDEEIDAALLGGSGAAGIRRLVDKAVNDRADALVREHIEPLNQTGIPALASLTKKITLEGMEHYAKYKTEIDERLGRMDAGLQTNPNALAMVYFAVVGEHDAERQKETEEATVRKIQEAAAGGDGSPGTATPGGSTGVTKREDKPTPDASTLAGQLGMEALAHKGNGGQDQDEFARGMGYASWDEYMKQAEELEKPASKPRVSYPQLVLPGRRSWPPRLSA